MLKVDRKLDGRLSCRKRILRAKPCAHHPEAQVFRLPCLSLLLIALALAMFAAVPPARAQSSADLQVAAAREGVVVIYAATDESVARELLRDFTRLYPGVRVEYHDMNSVELYRRFLAEQRRAAGPTCCGARPWTCRSSW